jgi:ribosomal protein L7Ae-like RNA K-turn-binding protein
VRFLSLLGIAQAAGRLVSGDAACEEALERNRVYLLVLANDASDNVKRRFLTRAARRGVPFVQMATKDTLGKAIGRSGRAVIGICDPALARNLQVAAKSD